MQECYEICYLLQPVNYFVETVTFFQQSDLDCRRFAIPLTPSSSSPIRIHPVYHLQTLPFALQLYALSPNTNPLTPSSSSPILIHSVYHLQTLHFTPQLYALSPNTIPLTPSSSSPIRSHSLYHLQTLHFALHL